MEKKIKKYATKILCLLSAIALWLFVTYTEDPESRLWFRDIPVTFVGADALQEKNLVFLEKDEEPKMHVKLAGRRSVLQRLLNSEIKATVDYSNVQEAGDCSLPVTVTVNRNDVQVIKLSHSSFSYKVDTLETVTKTVSITSSGAETLHLSQFTASPRNVKVTAPKSLVKHLTTSVHLDLSDGVAEATSPITVIDQRGNAVSSDLVKLDVDRVSITATRNMNISIEAMNMPQDKELEAMEYDPEFIPLRGKLVDLLQADVLQGVSPVWVDFSQSPARVGPVPLSIPNNLQPLEGTSATATFKFKQ